ncbi:MAG: SpoIIE family protein phosphatase [Rubripirellula sp.]
MISMRNERAPNGYQIRSLVQEVGKCREGALYQQRLEDDVTAFAVIDVTTEPMVTGNYVDDIIETLADDPGQLRRPLAVFESLNRRYCDDPVPVFAHVLAAAIDERTHRLTFSNAGLHPVFLRRKNGQLDHLGVDGIGLPLGIDRGSQFHCGDCDLEIGDMLMMLGVGMATALDTEDELGIDRILKIYSSGDGVDEVALQIELAIAQQTDQDVIESDRIGLLLQRVA